MEEWRKKQEKRAGRFEREALRPSASNDDADS
jgi:hypothetical protein